MAQESPQQPNGTPLSEGPAQAQINSLNELFHADVLTLEAMIAMMREKTFPNMIQKVTLTGSQEANGKAEM